MTKPLERIKHDTWGGGQPQAMKATPNRSILFTTPTCRLIYDPDADLVSIQWRKSTAHGWEPFDPEKVAARDSGELMQTIRLLGLRVANLMELRPREEMSA